eukprot:1161213-Pelagomonas_calceolata.AAC.12
MMTTAAATCPAAPPAGARPTAQCGQPACTTKLSSVPVVAGEDFLRQPVQVALMDGWMDGWGCGQRTGIVQSKTLRQRIGMLLVSSLVQRVHACFLLGPAGSVSRLKPGSNCMLGRSSNCNRGLTEPSAAALLHSLLSICWPRV